LINKYYVILFGPAVVVLYDVIRLHVAGYDSVWTEFEEVAELTGRARASVEPDQERILCDLSFGCVLSSVKHE
jgi:hypothetical protein